MSTLLKTAIIGCGDIAGGYDEKKTGEGVFSHAGAYREFDNIEITAAFDVDKERLAAFSKYWGVKKQCETLEQLLSEKYDIVSVCTPDNTHYEIMRKVIEHESAKYIWAEKPLTVSADTARSVIEAAKERNIGVWLNNQRRWEPCHLALQKKIASGGIGDIVQAVGYYVKGITHIGCTIIDTLRLLCGNINWVLAYLPFDKGSYGEDKSLRGILGLANGATANVVGCDSNVYTYSIFEIDIIGTKGRIKIEDNGDFIKVYEAKEYRHYPGFQELSLVKETETEMKWAVKYCLESLLKELSHQSVSVFYAEEGLKDLEVIDALKQSAQQGGKKIDL
jgi:predicted dehydrogenase